MLPCRKCGATDRNKSGNCRPCNDSGAVRYREKNPEKLKKYNETYNKAYYPTHKEERAVYRVVNSEKIAATKKKCHDRRRANDIRYKLAGNLRSRLVTAIKGSYKAGSSVQDLGCSIEELKTHLESLWLPGMDWASWEPKGWHIDHIIPLSKFDLTDREQFLKACHYTNLRPLWAEDNYKKGAK